MTMKSAHALFTDFADIKVIIEIFSCWYNRVQAPQDP